MILSDLRHLAAPLDELRPMPGNPRRGDVKAVARSLERFGQRKPIVAQMDGTVIAGNHTLAAARSLGWTEIAVVRVDDDPRTADAYALADNRTSDLGTYDNDALVALLAPIAAEDAGLLLATGYDDEDLAALLAEGEPSLPDPGDAPVDEAPFTWGVVVECANEWEQVALMERFAAEGLRVRPVMG